MVEAPAPLARSRAGAGRRHAWGDRPERFATCARNYAAAKVLADVGLRINEARMLDLDDIHPELGRFGKLAVRFGKGSNGSGPRTRMTPLINGTDGRQMPVLPTGIAARHGLLPVVPAPSPAPSQP